MSLLIPDTPMPRKNKPRRNDKVVKIDKDLAIKAKVIAELQEVYLAEYLSTLLRPFIEKDWVKTLRKHGHFSDSSSPQ